MSKMSFKQEKEFYRTNRSSEETTFEPWGNAQNYSDKGIIELVRKANELPFAYTIFSCSGLQEDHRPGREQLPYISMAFDPENENSYQMLEKILNTGMFDLSGYAPELKTPSKKYIRFSMMMPSHDTPFDKMIERRLHFSEELEESINDYIKYGWRQLYSIFEKYSV
jgi:hypothetical protein